MTKIPIAFRIWLIYHIIASISYVMVYAFDIYLEKDYYTRMYKLDPFISNFIPFTFLIISITIILSYFYNKKLLFYSSIFYVVFVGLSNFIFIFIYSLYHSITVLIYSLVGYYFYKHRNYFLINKR